MFVQWDHVEIESFYRAIRGYNVIAREEENPSMIVVNSTQDTSITSLTLNGLKKFTLYTVQVAAFSSENGPFLNVTVKTAEDSKYQWLIMRSGIIESFRFDYEYEYDYEIRHFWRQLLASSPAT